MARFGVASALAAATAAVAVAAATATTSAMTIAEIASGNPNLSLLVRALTAANMVDVVADPNASLTVFAPTDAAFVSLAEALGFEGNDTSAAFDAIVAGLAGLNGGDPIPPLTAVLQYHVAAGVVRSTDLVAAGGYMPLVGSNVTLAGDGMTLMDAAPAVADPKLTQTDINATNGIVHLIDGVLLPIRVGTPQPTTIAGLVVGNPDFSLLLSALTAADLVGVVANATASLTVFAPTNAAFVSLAKTLGFEGTNVTEAYEAIVAELTTLGGGDPIPTLSTILQYHVAAGELRASDVVAAGGFMPLAGPYVTLAADGVMLMDAAPAVADPKLTVTDVNATNGVLHIIDGVLLPIAIEPATPTPTPTPTPDESACFPADATVTLASGEAVRMDALAVGDAVAVGGGRFSDVFAFSHADADAASTFVELTVGAPAADACAAHERPLRLTPGHYLSVNGRMAAASTVAVGDVLLRADGSAAVVARVATRRGAGLFNPHTVDGSILVDGIVTSTYTTAVEPRVAAAALTPLRALYAVGGGRLGGFLTEASRLAGLLPRGPLVV